MSERKIPDTLVFKGPLYEDGYGHKYEVRYQARWPSHGTPEDQRAMVTISWGVSGNDSVLIDRKDLPDLIRHLQELEAITQPHTNRSKG